MRVDEVFNYCAALQEWDGARIGDYFPRLLREAVLMGVRLSDCPFDTGDYRYTGPVISRTDGYPWMRAGGPQGGLFNEGSIQD